MEEIGRFGTFGEICLLKNGKQSTSIITTLYTQCYVLNKWDVMRILDYNVIRNLPIESHLNSKDDDKLLSNHEKYKKWIKFKDQLKNNYN